MPPTNWCQPTKAGSSVGSPGCRRFRSRDDTSAIVTSQVASRNRSWPVTGGQISGPTSLLPDYVDRDLHRRNRSSVLEPVQGVPVLGPAHSRPIVRSDSISMISDRSLQYVDSAWPVFVVMNRTEDA